MECFLYIYLMYLVAVCAVLFGMFPVCLDTVMPEILPLLDVSMEVMYFGPHRRVL
jgi:hypothetical protein